MIPVMALIGLLSDVHATPGPVEEALSIFSDAGVDEIFCAGDIAGYYDQCEETVSLIMESGCQTVIGNHDLQYLDHYDDTKKDLSADYFKQLPTSIEKVIDGKRVYMVHAQPPDGCHGGIKLLDKEGVVMPERLRLWDDSLNTFDHDVLVVGHTHQVFAEVIADTLVVNPGSSIFNNCCAILKLPEMTVDMHSLSKKAIVKTWNWGDFIANRY